MGNIRSPLPVKLFVSVLTSLPHVVAEVESRLSELYGRIDRKSAAFEFDMTRYYDEEMGTPLRRTFLAFSDLIDPVALTGIKRQSNGLEEFFATRHVQVKRPVNLDPGYLDQAKVVLASTKDFSHRIYVAEGIYEEVTLYYQGGQWRSWPWTFPDFRAGRYDEFFAVLRNSYRMQLSGAGSHLRTEPRR
jgi:hypothetical protein